MVNITNDSNNENRNLSNHGTYQTIQALIFTTWNGFIANAMTFYQGLGKSKIGGSFILID